MTSKTLLNRRLFLKNSSTLFGGCLMGSHTLLGKKLSTSKIPLGFDNFSIRALGWKAPKLIEYASRQKVDALLFSDLDVYESHDHGYLKEVGQEVKKQNIILHAGTGGICPTSKSFKDKYGSAEEHLRLLIKVAKSLGSSIARCYLGSSKDRKTEGGIRVHMQSTIQILKKVRSLALDAGVKIAVEKTMRGTCTVGNLSN